MQRQILPVDKVGGIGDNVPMMCYWCMYIVSLSPLNMVTCMCAAEEWALNHGYPLLSWLRAAPHYYNVHTISTNSAWGVAIVMCMCGWPSQSCVLLDPDATAESRGRLRSVNLCWSQQQMESCQPIFAQKHDMLDNNSWVCKTRSLVHGECTENILPYMRISRVCIKI